MMSLGYVQRWHAATAVMLVVDTLCTAGTRRCVERGKAQHENCASCSPPAQGLRRTMNTRVSNSA